MASYDDVMTALRNADAAGDTEAAQRLAGIASRLRDQQTPAAPAAPARRGAAAIPVGGTADAPIYADQRPPAPTEPAPEPGVMGALKRAGAQAYGGLEAATAVGTGATTGLLGGILSAANNVAGTVTKLVTGQDTSGQPGLEQAFTQGMQAGTYQPRTKAGQEQAEVVGSKLQEHGPALMGLGPELAAIGEATRGAGPAAAAATHEGAARAGEAVVPTISRERAANAQAGMDQGLSFAPHQLADNKLVKMAGSEAESAPGAFGGMRRTERQAAFNRALIKHVNPESDATRLTGDVLGEAMDRSGGKIGDITSRTDLPLEDVQQGFEAQRRALGRTSEDTQRMIGGYIDEFERLAAENNGTIPGSAFKDLNGELGRDIRANAGSPIGHKLSDLQDVVLDAFRDRLTPEDRTAYDTSRAEYAKAKTILPLVAKSVEGDIAPASLMQAVNATKAGKEAMGRGRAGDLGDLARAGKYLVDPKSSGTAERGLVYKFILDPLKETAKAATAYPAMAAYNLASPAITRAMVRKGLRAGGAAAEDAPPAGGVPPAGDVPPGGAPGTPAPAGGAAAAADPRLASVAEARQAATSDAVRAALDEHEKTVRKAMATEQAAKKQAADVDALEAAARATQDVELRKTLQAKADKLRGAKIPTGEATELATTPTPKPEKPGKIPVGKVIEGAPAERPAAPAEPIPAGEATEIAPEVVEPTEPIPAGEASPLPSNRPASEVVSNVPQAEPVSNTPRGEAPPASNVPQAETDAYTHRALFDEAAKRGIDVRGKRPSEVRTHFETAWAKEHGLNPFEANRAKATAKALDINEKAVEAAAKQFERSPRAFDRAVDQIIERGTPNAPEAEQAATRGQSNPPNAAGSQASPGVGRGGNANDGAGGASGSQSDPHAGGAVGAAEATAEQPGANGPAATGANAAAGVARGQTAAGEGTILKDKRGGEHTVTVKTENFGADKGSKSVLVEARDPATGERRGFVDFAVRPDGVLVAENAKVAPAFKQRGIAELMYRAARDAGHDIAPGRVQTDEGHAMVESLQRKGLINKEAEGKRFRAGDLDLAPIEGETIPGEKATRPEQPLTEAKPVASAPTPAPRGFEKGAQKVKTEPKGFEKGATHKDPGAPSEAVTPTVVTASLSKGAKAGGGARDALLTQIDQAIAKAPARPADIGTTEPRTVRGKREFLGVRGDMRVEVREGSDGLWHVSDSAVPVRDQSRKAEIIRAHTPRIARQVVESMLARATKNEDGHLVYGEGDFVHFKVQGDGVFKVRNDPDRLAEFRTQVEKSPGFNAAGQRPQKVPEPEGAHRGSGGAVAAVANMIEEGDYQAAYEYAQFKGVKTESLKVPLKAMTQFKAWVRDNEPLE